MRTIIGLMILTLIGAQPIRSQSGSLSPEAIHLDSTKPTVFITYEKTEERAGKKMAVLIIHNNSLFDLTFCTYTMTPPSALQIFPCYSVESSGHFETVGKGWKWVGPHAPLFARPDIINDYVLKSGSDSHFDVPQEFLAKGLRVVVSFKYPWEKWPQTEPLHQVWYETED